ncbi:MAG: DNA translocase FtsK 4TM domain-containing protein [Candidatus Aminicenantes bacterium]|nr:DNA translocase FtsK 4TM domain-containing protein [Candidatus Aminicenantes bacterium]
MAKIKKRAPASPSKPARNRRGPAAEIAGVVLIALALFSLISLVSYNAADPSWFAASEAATRNVGGKVGASLADALLQALGLAAFLVPFMLGAIGTKTILSHGDRRLFVKAGFFIWLIVLLAPFLSLVFGRLVWRGGDISSGGLLGSSLASFLVRYLNQAGAVLALIVLFLLLGIFSTKLSLKQLLQMASGLFRFAVKEVRIKVSRYQRSKERDKMRKKVIEKYTAPAEIEVGEKRPEAGKERPPVPREDRERRTRESKPALKPPLPPPGPAPVRPEPYLFPDMGKKGDYTFPPLNLLDQSAPAEQIDKDELYDKKIRIEQKLKEFRVEGEVREYHPGPVITTYEFYPFPGIKVSQVANLTEDLSLALGAESVRIQRIPGKSSLGVEIPNNKRETIRIRDILQSEKFRNSPSKLTIALGKTVHGETYITDLGVMPHLLIAGATGTGKSVALNALIASILYKATPDEVKLILIDPKRIEFTLYDGIPHLISPVINDPKKAGIILMDAIKRMEERYQMLLSFKVRNIEQYNQMVRQMIAEKRGKLTDEDKEKLKPLPYLVIIIDELAELMMIGSQEVEFCIARLAQLARAVGIHLVMATQRPSIDVITGTIKNNFSSRIAFRVPSKIDSRIILDTSGAEKLLGLGDMLFMPPNYPRLLRLHSAFISTTEISRIVKFAKGQRAPVYDEKIIRVIKGSAEDLWQDSGERDALYEKAVELVLLTGQASASYLQRKMKFGYARAARVIDQMEQDGILGPSEGSKPRDILVEPADYLKKKEREK